MLLRALPILFAASVMATAWSAEEPAGDLKKFQGTWSILSMERGGETAPEEVLKAMIIFAKDRMIMQTPAKADGGAPFKREFTVKLLASSTPKAIDLTPLEEPNKGVLIEGIYQLAEDELKLCLPNAKVASRPTEMKSPKGSRH